MDRLTPERRSLLMSRIRSKDTQPELVVRRMVHAMGYRYTLHGSKLPGRPDLVFPSRKKVVFVHGCFWHGHQCPRGFKPKSNAAIWEAKISGNRSRDRRTLLALRKLGWRSMVIWECATHGAALAQMQWRLIKFLEE
jgi:DNA mismatch endonuclease (patch repair protein)